MPFVVPCLSTSSSTTCTPTSSSSSSQDSENPVPEKSGSTSEEQRGNPLHKPTETENKNKQEGREGVHSDLLHDLLDWLQEFRENLVDEHNPSESRETLSLDIETLPVLLMNYQWSREQKWNWVLVSMVSTRTFREAQIEISTSKKITRVSCRKRTGTVVPRAEKFLDLTADHQVLSDNCESRNNHRHVVVVQELATQWVQSYPCKSKTSQETERSLQKFLEPTTKPKVIYTDNSLEFGKSCEELSWNHCTSTPHRSETNGIERAACTVKEGASAVLLLSGLDEKWRADSMECYTYLRNIQDLV